MDEMYTTEDTRRRHELHALFDDALGDLMPVPDLATGAVRKGRRRRRLTQLGIGAAVLAVLGGTAASASLLGSSGGASQTGPAAQATLPSVKFTVPPGTYPVVHVTPTASGKPGVKPLNQHQLDFKQQVVDHFAKTLPVGTYKILDNNMNGYQLVTGSGTFMVTVRADKPIGDNSAAPSNGASAKPGAGGDYPVTAGDSTYGLDVQVYVFDSTNGAKPPVTSADLTKVLDQQEFKDLMTQWAKDPSLNPVMQGGEATNAAG